MIKKHEHRKQNRQILKLPKKSMHGMQSISSYDSDSDYDKSSMIKSNKRKTIVDDSASTVSIASNTGSVTSSKITSLARVRANQDSYHTQQMS